MAKHLLAAKEAWECDELDTDLFKLSFIEEARRVGSKGVSLHGLWIRIRSKTVLQYFRSVARLPLSTRFE
eukprot:2552508-Amphidinium_carterae.1